MGHKKRATDKIIIVEDRKNNRVLLKKNLGWFKNLFSTFNTFSTKFREKVKLTAFLGTMGSLLGIVLSFIVDGAALGEYTRAVERIHSVYSPEVAQAVIDQTVSAPTSIGPWVAVFGGAVMLISLTTLIISVVSDRNNRKAEPRYIKYDKSINSDFFAAIPNELFEQLYSVSQSIQATEDDMKKLEKALNKPMSDFLKEDVSKQLRILRENKEEFLKDRLSIYQKTVNILKEHERVTAVERLAEEKIKYWKDKKKNDSEVLEVLGEMTAAQEMTKDIENIENSETQYKNARLSSR